ncbi:MAG: hypothetical protein J2P53_14170, partial [Bradyrhizobiaceae bacterium]|nr:hypothetical protein [Bradyrhizobiaceae bacterium]
MNIAGFECTYRTASSSTCLMAGCRSWRDEARLGRDEVEVRRRQVDGDGARAVRQHDAMQGRRDADQRLGHRKVHQPDCRIAQERCDVSFP